MSRASRIRESDRIHDTAIGYVLAAVLGSLAVAILAYIAATTVHEREIAAAEREAWNQTKVMLLQIKESQHGDGGQ